MNKNRGSAVCSPRRIRNKQTKRNRLRERGLNRQLPPPPHLLPTSSPVLLRWNQTSRRLHTMCLSCSRNENSRLYLFMQLSVMMMFSGQSTWESTPRKREAPGRGGGEDTGLAEDGVQDQGGQQLAGRLAAAQLGGGAVLSN
ncbi:hypothetical protein EYF80_013775 [Liparis tanakae]|uniref:Uncharacterized protein n=1 Tax=Liparis tanakae TaxID=230148 RepID=A0A4Z2IFB7_9TELE|nr:hypothetical protein EYF80_013775 [Liparis tanakae]